MKDKTLLIALGGLGLVAACLLVFSSWPQAATKPTGDVADVGAEASVVGMDEMRKVVKSHVQKNGRAHKKLPGKLSEWVDVSMFERLSGADRELCEAVQSAMDADDGGKTIELCSKLMASSDPVARSHAVDALGWFGAEALPELTTLMGDPDDDVAQSAVNAWESGIFEIDDAKVRFKVTGIALRALSNEDALQSISSQYSNAATELIDSAEGEEAALDMRTMVIQSVVDIIDSSNKRLSDLGRELYEDITGNEWLNLTEAEKYLNDPDNYEPPEEFDETRVDDSESGEETNDAERKDESAIADEPNPDVDAVAEPEAESDPDADTVAEPEADQVESDS